MQRARCRPLDHALVRMDIPRTGWHTPNDAIAAGPLRG